MPKEVMPVHDLDTAWGFLRHLADIVESKVPEKVFMEAFHKSCGTAHCAWGWAEITPELRARMSDKSTSYMKLYYWRMSTGLTPEEADYCFGSGYQFAYLRRPYTPADVARHLREVADAVQTRQ